MVALCALLLLMRPLFLGFFFDDRPPSGGTRLLPVVGYLPGMKKLRLRASYRGGRAAYSLQPFFRRFLKRENHLHRVRVCSVGEHIVGVHDLVHLEVVGAKHRWIQTPLGNQLQKGWSGGCVD